MGLKSMFRECCSALGFKGGSGDDFYDLSTAQEWGADYGKKFEEVSHSLLDMFQSGEHSGDEKISVKWFKD